MGWADIDEPIGKWISMPSPRTIRLPWPYDCHCHCHPIPSIISRVSEPTFVKLWGVRGEETKSKKEKGKKKRKEKKKKHKLTGGWAGASSHDGNSIVVEDGGNVFAREFVGGIADEQTRLAHGSVADNNTPTDHTHTRQG